MGEGMKSCLIGRFVLINTSFLLFPFTSFPLTKSSRDEGWWTSHPSYCILFSKIDALGNSVLPVLPGAEAYYFYSFSVQVVYVSITGS